jgi:HSP20 family protein
MANIARWDPFEDSPFDIFPALFGRQPTLRTADARMRMDVVETDADYRVSIDLPGIDKDSIQVSVDRNNVTISARPREQESAPGQGQWLLRERAGGAMSRTLSLPEAVDDGKSEARHVDGVLYLTLPKAAGSMKRLTVH